MSNPHCSLHDGGIFVGLTSLPLANERRFISDLTDLFHSRREELKDKTRPYEEISSEKFDELNEKFYLPKYYYLFGKFDLAAISLVEGFNFPVRQFNSFNFQRSSTSKESRRRVNFAKHSILGPTPRFEGELIDFYDLLDPEGANRYPLIGITRLKVNDFFLFDHGVDFIRACIKCIRFKLSEKSSYRKHFSFLILENYSWTEITLLIFSNSYEVCYDLLLPELRNFSCTDMCKILPLDVINEESLSEKLKETQKRLSLSDAPVFIDSHTVFGFDIDMYFDKNSVLNEKISDNDIINPVFEWSVKPGSLSTVIDQFAENGIDIDHSDALIVAGKTDILYQFHSRRNLSTKSLIRLISAIRNNPTITKHLNSIETIISILTQVQSSDPRFEAFYQKVSGKLQKTTYSNKEMDAFKERLEYLLIPHVSKEAILNFIGVYNEALIDHLSFSNFLELYVFLEYIDIIVESHYEKGSSLKWGDSLESERLIRTLDNGLHAFNYACDNRVLGNHLMGDQYDYYMFLTIGAQSLISAFDSLYKSISAIIGNPLSFAYLEADHEFTTSDFALRLNYFHIFNPELLSAVIFQEVSNQVKVKFSKHQPELFYFHRQKDSQDETGKIDKLIYEVGYHDELISEYSDYLAFCKQEYFEHIFSDIVGYRLFYIEDSDLYQFWSWGYFATDSKHYKRYQKKVDIDEYKFIMYLTRQLLVLKVLDQEAYENYSVEIDPRLNVLARKEIKRAKEFIEKFIIGSRIKDWLHRVKQFSDELYSDIKNKSQIEYSSSDKFSNVLNNGNIVVFDGSGNDQDAFVHSKNLLYSYLKSVRDLCGNKPLNIYDRVDNVVDAELGSGILFDPLGGTFTVDPKKRREMYKLRSAFHMSLIDMSLKQKGKMLEKIIDLRTAKRKQFENC